MSDLGDKLQPPCAVCGESWTPGHDCRPRIQKSPDAHGEWTQLVKDELIIPVADLVGPDGGTLAQVLRLYERAIRERNEARRDRDFERSRCAELSKAADEYRAESLRIMQERDDWEQKAAQCCVTIWRTVECQERCCVQRRAMRDIGQRFMYVLEQMGFGGRA